jgi:hypothetical protein
VVPPSQPGDNTTRGVNAHNRVKKLHRFVTTIVRTTGLTSRKSTRRAKRSCKRRKGTSGNLQGGPHLRKWIHLDPHSRARPLASAGYSGHVQLLARVLARTAVPPTRRILRT